MSNTSDNNSGDYKKTAAEQLATPVQFLKGAGPRRGELFGRLELRTVADLLFYFPRSYQDMTDRRDVPDLEEDVLQSVCGVVEESDVRSTARGGCVQGVLVRCKSGHVRGLWFNQPHMKDKFPLGGRVVFAGKPKLRGMVWEFNHPKVESLGADEEEPPGKLLPVYGLTDGVQQWSMRKIVENAVETYGGLLDEVFPPEYLIEHDLLPLHEALPRIHSPESHEVLAQARRRFVYQELFILQLALAVKRYQQRSQQKTMSLATNAKIDARIKRLFPFELTPGQCESIEQIAADMACEIPMNRLLQGDVGSGKTVVAVYGMLLAVANGSQAVMMAPTEILARQHMLTLNKMLGSSEVRRVQLTGGMPAKQRAAVLEQIAAGEVDIVIGTQAIIQNDVEFKRLGLVVIDEQHKFGVRQRAMLRQAGVNPHYLVMTATPIPRTVTMTLFGDLDVSTIRDTPPGRQKVNTYLAEEDKRQRWWEFFRKKLVEGRQAYVVTPLVDESDTQAVASLQESYEALANGELEAFRLGLVHGRMTPAEKDAVMDDFRTSEIQVLVCTSVIEVGVDVPNATLMTIESGQQFGLAQLHQLRGRISRGSFPGFCCVFADPQTEDAQKRLDALVSTTDGFKLAEMDFKLRGPGDLFGTQQHGLPPLRIADLITDATVVEEARADAQALVTSDPGLSEERHAKLRRMMLGRYGKALDLGDVG